MSKRKPTQETGDVEPVVFPEPEGMQPSTPPDTYPVEARERPPAETASQTVKMPVLIPQPNGKGALLSGGMPGNRGGGRRRAIVADACLESFAQRIPLLEAIADGKVMQKMTRGDGTELHVEVSADVRDRVAAVERLGRFGGLPEPGPVELTGHVQIIVGMGRLGVDADDDT